MAVWLQLDDATDLFSSSMDSSTLKWDLSGARTEDVVWHDVQDIIAKNEHGTAVTLPNVESSWQHEVAFIPRCVGTNCCGDRDSPTHCFCVHRLTLLADRISLNQDLVVRAIEWEAESIAGGRVSLDSSNVKGFHSGRSVEDWCEDKLLALLNKAIGNVQRVETELQKLDGPRSVSSRADDPAQDEPAADTGETDELAGVGEIWLNVSRSGAWNILHTHPGSRWSGSYYVSDGGALCHGGGQLMLLATPSPQLGEHHNVHMLSLAAARIAAGSSLSEHRDHNELYFLQVPPTPGSMVVFPSFVPHFVLPCHAEASGSSDVGNGCGGSQMLPRISIAFNVD